MKKLILSLVASALSLGMVSPLVGVAADPVELDFAAIETAYGPDVWPEIIEAYKEVNPDVTINLTQEKELEDAITPRMQAGDYPDVIMLGLSREKALPETLIKDKGLANLNDILTTQIPGEDVTVESKLLDGFTDSTSTNPYNDGDTYLMPMFYSPTGLFYNKHLFEEQGWQVPTTWDDMWKLSEAAGDTALFTYPVAGYLDTLFSSLINNKGGNDLFAKAMAYDPEVWKGQEMTDIFNTLGQLAQHTEGTTVANANPTDYTRNQQLVLDNKALFVPNGTWVVGEMADAPRADGFEWGMMAAPTFEEGADRYAYTFIEHIWIPEAAENKEAAQQFIAFLYSDKAADIFLKHGAIQPIQGMVDKLDDEQKTFYSIYEDGVLPAMGGFVSTQSIPGVDLKATLYGTFDGVVSGDTTVEEWQQQVVDVMEQFHNLMN